MPISRAPPPPEPMHDHQQHPPSKPPPLTELSPQTAPTPGPSTLPVPTAQCKSVIPNPSYSAKAAFGNKMYYKHHTSSRSITLQHVASACASAAYLKACSISYSMGRSYPRKVLVSVTASVVSLTALITAQQGTISFRLSKSGVKDNSQLQAPPPLCAPSTCALAGEAPTQLCIVSNALVDLHAKRVCTQALHSSSSSNKSSSDSSSNNLLVATQCLSQPFNAETCRLHICAQLPGGCPETARLGPSRLKHTTQARHGCR
jgi:hypothetical protein